METDVTSSNASALTGRTPLKIFLTDTASGLGQVVTRRLAAAGHQVVGLTTGAAGADRVRSLGALPVYADPTRPGELRNAMRLRETDVIIHLAPQTANHLPAPRGAWDHEAARIVRETDAILQAAAEAGAKFVLHTSYAFVYGDQHGQWVDETTRPEPGDDAFVKAALKAEKHALSAAVPGCVLRLGYLYGAEADSLRALVRVLRLGRPVMTTPGYANWVHLEDAAEAIRRVAEAQPAGGIYNVVDYSPASSADFVNHFAAALGLHAPGNLPRAIAQWLPGTVDFVTNPGSLRVKNTRLVNDLGWTPRFASHTAGFEDTLLTWRANDPAAAPASESLAIEPA